MFRFTIRDLLWLMVVVGLATGWSLEYFHSPNRQLYHRAAGMRWALESEGWVVHEDGWTMTVRKPTDKDNSYEVNVLP